MHQKYFTQIFPTNAKKYSGNIQQRKKVDGSFSYKVDIRFTGIHFMKTFQTYEEAFECLKKKNLELDLPIKNMIWKYRDHMEVELTQGERCKFDEEELELIQECNFYARRGYAFFKIKRKEVALHNLLMEFHPCKERVVDHINRNSLDNRKANLRIVDIQTQCINKNIQKNNKTGTNGVYYCNTYDAWCSKWVKEDGKTARRIFSVEKYGDEEAKKLAIARRKKAEKELPHYKKALCL